MGMPNGFQLEFPSDDDGVTAKVGTSKQYNASDLVAGYDFTRGGTAAFVGDLEGSVGGNTWTSITSLAASAQGVVPAHYRLVRIKIGTAGLVGGSELWYHGKS